MENNQTLSECKHWNDGFCRLLDRRDIFGTCICLFAPWYDCRDCKPKDNDDEQD